MSWCLCSSLNITKTKVLSSSLNQMPQALAPLSGIPGKAAEPAELLPVSLCLLSVSCGKLGKVFCLVLCTRALKIYLKIFCGILCAFISFLTALGTWCYFEIRLQAALMTPNGYFPVTPLLVFTLSLAVIHWKTHDNFCLKKLRLCLRFWIKENSENIFLLTGNEVVYKSKMLGPMKSVKSKILPMWSGFIWGFAFNFIIIIVVIILAKSLLSGIPNLLVFTEEFSIISLAAQVNKYNHGEYANWFTFAK